MGNIVNSSILEEKGKGEINYDRHGRYQSVRAKSCSKLLNSKPGLTSVYAVGVHMDHTYQHQEQPDVGLVVIHG